MDQNSKSNSTVPVQTTSPEEDATLLAIEALEARTVDPNPRPLNAPRDIDVPDRIKPVIAPAPKVIEPIVIKPVEAPAPKPIVIEPPKVEIKPEPKPVPVIEAPKIIPKPVPTPPPKPKKPLTPSEEIAEALASAPAPKGFQFFAGQKAPRKQFVIIAIAVVLVAGGIAAYFATR